MARRCSGGWRSSTRRSGSGSPFAEIRDLRGARDELAHQRLRQLALLKLPELDDLIARASSVRRVLKSCSRCKRNSIDVRRMFDERVLPLRALPPPDPSRTRRRVGAAD